MHTYSSTNSNTVSATDKYTHHDDETDSFAQQSTFKWPIVTAFQSTFITTVLITFFTAVCSA